MHALITTTMLFLFSMLLLIIDGLLYSLLNDIRTYGRIEYAQVGNVAEQIADLLLVVNVYNVSFNYSLYKYTGHHDLELHVQGTGFLASLLRSVVNSFSVKQRVKRVISNDGRY